MRVRVAEQQQAHAGELQLRNLQPRLERLLVRFALGAPPRQKPPPSPVAPGVRHAARTPSRERAEHAANRARKDTGNEQLNLTDAVLSFSHKDPARDRVYQVALASDSTLQHAAVRQSFKAFVQFSHQPHHDVLQELTLQHPEDVFQNGTQRRIFEALCTVVDLPLSILPPQLPPTSAAAAGLHGAVQ